MPPVPLWIRAETRPSERRTPLVPADVAALVAAGLHVVLERSPERCFPDREYAAAGARLVDRGSWVDAPADAVILGLKELPAAPTGLRHSHAFFGHAYRGQPGARDVLRRFTSGGGELLDLEYLRDDSGRRLAAFGHWAGYAGAALGLLEWWGHLPAPLSAVTKEHLDHSIAQAARTGPTPRVLVVGALGRSGRGALAALELAGVDATAWDTAETRDINREALLAHDIVVNTVMPAGPIAPFLTLPNVSRPGRRLSILADVTCDIGSARNAFPLHRETTTWNAPVLTLPDVDPDLRVIAIDNLPSLLPKEASMSFSADLSPHLPALREVGGVWAECRAAFRESVEALEQAPNRPESIDA